jgi:hypothetical protein
MYKHLSKLAVVLYLTAPLVFTRNDSTMSSGQNPQAPCQGLNGVPMFCMLIPFPV